MKLKAASLAAVLGFSLTEMMTGQVGFAALFAFISAVLAAWLASRPALMQAQTAREQLHNTETAQAEAKQERIHADEVAWLKSRIIFNSQALVLTRQSKHNILSYAQELGAYTQKVQGLLRDKGGEVPPFQFKFYDDLCGDEDRALLALSVPAEALEPKGGKG